MAFLLRENWRHGTDGVTNRDGWTDRRTDRRGATLNAAPRACRL